MENTTNGLNALSVSTTSSDPDDLALTVCSPAVSWSRERESVKLDMLEVIDVGEVFEDGPAGVPSVSVIVKKKPDRVDRGYAYDAVVLRTADERRSCQDGFNCIVSDCCGNMLLVSNPLLNKLGIPIGSTIILSKDNIITVASGS